MKFEKFATAKLKQCFVSEIKFVIGHAPSVDEYESALDYVSVLCNQCTDFSDIQTLIYDWRAECLQQCDECGEYFLKLEEFDHNTRVMGKQFCSRQCCDNWEYWHPDEKPEISQHI